MVDFFSDNTYVFSLLFFYRIFFPNTSSCICLFTSWIIWGLFFTLSKLMLRINVGLMSRVFANGPGDRSSISGRVIPKTQKWYLMLPCLALSTIRWGSRVKWGNLGNQVAPSPTPRCSCYWKCSLRVSRSPSTKDANFTYIYIYKLNNEFCDIFQWNAIKFENPLKGRVRFLTISDLAEVCLSVRACGAYDNYVLIDLLFFPWREIITTLILGEPSVNITVILCETMSVIIMKCLKF